MDDYDVTSAMIEYGGSFVRNLGKLWHTADTDNKSKLKAAFPEYWAQYTEVVQLKQAQQPKDPR